MFSYQDQVLLTLLSGRGGKGSLSFFRSRKNPRGGPDGGDGGAGGDILFVPESRFKDLSHFKNQKKFKAGDGKSGRGQNKTGARGEDKKIPLPLGTVVKDEKDNILVDLTQAEPVLFLKGGRGGKGNAFFKTSLNQAPAHFQKGELGIEKKVKLEFKPLAEVALIGKANAGKSTFLNAVTEARSPVATYPYTTLAPYLGQIKQTSFFIIDIPGLERSASEKVSKGLSFLRSIQRARLLLHFVDVTSPSFMKDKKDIEEEIKKFDKKFPQNHFLGLSQKTKFLILSKSDQVTKTKLNILQKKLDLKNQQIKKFPLSGLKKEGIKELLIAIKKEIS